MHVETDDPRPQPPMEPAADACCGEGCVNCVLDLHDAALARYREALEAWRQRRRSGDTADSGERA